jgi:hypothetical protein
LNNDGCSTGLFGEDIAIATKFTGFKRLSAFLNEIIKPE